MTKILLVVLAGACLGLAVTEDSVAMESETNYRQVQHVYPEERRHDGEIHYSRRPKKFHRSKAEKKRNLVHREREARNEDSWKIYEEGDVKGPVYELPPGYEIEGKYREEPKSRYFPVEEEAHVQYEAPQKHREEDEKLKVESSQNPGSSYLNHIKEQISDGKLLGYSSFVEHFSENDDAEELKTAMKEGSLDDIKKLVPKSSVSFQMYHGEEEKKTVKYEPAAEKKEISWNELNEWHQPTNHPTPTQWTQTQTHLIKPASHKTYILADHKKRTRKHPEGFRLRHNFHSEQSGDEIHSTSAPEFEHKVIANELREQDENYPRIVPSLSFEIPSLSYARDKEYEYIEGSAAEQDRQESRNGYAFDGESGAWRPVGKAKATDEQQKNSNAPKPPESSKIYYEHFKNSKPAAAREDTANFGQLPKAGRVVVERPAVTHATKYGRPVKSAAETFRIAKKPPRITSTPQPTFKWPAPPPFASGEDSDRHYAQIPTASSVKPVPVAPRPTRFRSEADTPKDGYLPDNAKWPGTPAKPEKILDKQTEQIERPGEKGNGNIFLTKEFRNEVSEFFKGGKSDFEWVPSTPMRYDRSAHASGPAAYQTGAPDVPEPKPKKYRIYRSDRNSGAAKKNVVLLGQASEIPGEFSVSASYRIDRNRKSDADQAQ